jgi:hypothetical protein
MGGLPQVFNGDRARADDFIEEVKGYLRLNQDVARYNFPIKKVTFTLTLIKGPEVAGCYNYGLMLCLPTHLLMPQIGLGSPPYLIFTL